MGTDLPDDVDEEQVTIRLIELPWSRMQDIAAGDPYFVDAGKELIAVVRDTVADDVVATFDESIEDLRVIDDAG